MSQIMPDIQQKKTIPPMNRLHVTEQGRVKIVLFIENKILDETNIQEIGQGLLYLADQATLPVGSRPKMLLDFSNIDHLSSAALGMLIQLNHRIKQLNGELRLCNIKSALMEVFVITRLDKSLRILPNVDDAMATFSPN